MKKVNFFLESRGLRGGFGEALRHSLVDVEGHCSIWCHSCYSLVLPPKGRVFWLNYSQQGCRLWWVALVMLPVGLALAFIWLQLFPSPYPIHFWPASGTEGAIGKLQRPNRRHCPPSQPTAKQGRSCLKTYKDLIQPLLHKANCISSSRKWAIHSKPDQDSTITKLW